MPVIFFSLGLAVRPCLSTGQFKEAKWGQVDFSDCMSRQIIELHEEVRRKQSVIRFSQLTRQIGLMIPLLKLPFKIVAPKTLFKK